MSVIVKGMDMPESCGKCFVGNREICVNGCPLIPVPQHGRLIDADELETDLKRQCKEVFRTDAVSPDDYWITRNQAYNENLWKTWCESFYDYLKTRPTIIPAEEGELWLYRKTVTPSSITGTEIK